MHLFPFEKEFGYAIFYFGVKEEDSLKPKNRKGCEK